MPSEMTSRLAEMALFIRLETISRYCQLFVNYILNGKVEISVGNLGDCHLFNYASEIALFSERRPACQGLSFR